LLRTRIVAVAAGIAALALVASAGAVTPKLVGTDGPGFTITLKKAGKAVKTLKAGKYTFAISDKSSIHNFHLTGPGVNKMTSVPKVGTTTWTVTLKKGIYRFVCDPHKTIMKGSFKVV
jgi:plastocyanin